MITYIDLKIGNIGSLLRAFDHLGAPLRPAHGPAALDGASAIILPGVGAYGDGMASLRDQGLIEPLRAAATSGTPFFGICLGMQLMAESSEEHGLNEGLGLIRGRLRRLEATQPGFRVPNIGWCDVTPRRSGMLFPNGKGGSFYHVHSFALDGADPDAVAATIEFNGEPVPVAIECGTLFGVQFHPEKSQDDGLDLLANFLAHLLRLGRLPVTMSPMS
jgi:glutamine amidotransferase